MQRCLFSKRTLRGRSLCFVLEMINQVTPPDTCSVQAPSGGVTFTLSLTSQGYAISLSLDFFSSTHLRISVGTTADKADPSEDPSSTTIPAPLTLSTSPFLSSDDDTTDSDTLDTPSSPAHDTPFTEITASTQRSLIIPHRQVMLLAPGPSISHRSPMTFCTCIIHLKSGALFPVLADFDTSRLKNYGIQRLIRMRHWEIMVQSIHDHTQQSQVHRVQTNEEFRESRDKGWLGLIVRRCLAHRSGASMTREEFGEGIGLLTSARVAEEIEAREAAMNLEPLNENGDELEGENGRNGNGGKRGNGGMEEMEIEMGIMA
ncbi:hypothetical protein Tco_0824608 [Tanacetum coccineum]|uniref:Uncharacterized protein n=1 Tax=Tanacetum coccineum TaxID=301880 RepID=A0ABQ5AN08_9ASTR